jgi:hypothetical protein
VLLKILSNSLEKLWEEIISQLFFLLNSNPQLIYKGWMGKKKRRVSKIRAF